MSLRIRIRIRRRFWIIRWRRRLFFWRVRWRWLRVIAAISTTAGAWCRGNACDSGNTDLRFKNNFL
jgi:hypothetical protein